MDRRANYHIEKETAKYIILRDDGPWDRFITVTNAAESVIDELIPMLSGRRVFYYDSEGEFAELVLKDGKFAGFAHADAGKLAEIEKAPAVIGMPNIVKVKYFSETTGGLSGREYTYFSADPVGDVLIVPVRDTVGKAKVSAIDVPEAEIAAFKDKVKTIPAESLVKEVPPQFREMEEGLNSEGLTLDPNAWRTGEEEVRVEPPEEPVIISRAMPIGTALIDIAPTEDMAVIALYNESLALRTIALERVIKVSGDMARATEDLSLVKKLSKALEDYKKKYAGPIRAHLDAVNSAFKELMAPLEEAERVTKTKMLAFNAEQDRIRRNQEEINNLRMEAAQKEAALNGGEISQPVELVEVAPEAPKRVNTEVGAAGTMKVRKWKLVDISKVPPAFLLVDAGKVTKLVKAGIGSIPGIEIYEEESIRVTAR